MRCAGTAVPPRCEVYEELRVLADTNVLVAAVTSNEGVSARLLIAARSGQYRLIVSEMLLHELETVLARPKFRRHLSNDDVQRFLVMVRELAEVVDDPPAPTQPITPDPDDDFLVVLAEAAGADVLVSGDWDLTGLNRAGLTVKTPASSWRPSLIPDRSPEALFEESVWSRCCGGSRARCGRTSARGQALAVCLSGRGSLLQAEPLQAANVV